MDFTKHFNKLNEQSVFCKLSDLNIGEPYRIVRLDNSFTMYGTALVATLEKNGRIFSVFLPKRFKLDKQLVDEYNENEDLTSLIYLGIFKGRHELRFI
jgi:hypothetical protein